MKKNIKKQIEAGYGDLRKSEKQAAHGKNRRRKQEKKNRKRGNRDENI